jgi:hypothetical protein
VKKRRYPYQSEEKVKEDTNDWWWSSVIIILWVCRGPSFLVTRSPAISMHTASMKKISPLFD